MQGVGLPVSGGRAAVPTTGRPGAGRWPGGGGRPSASAAGQRRAGKAHRSQASNRFSRSRSRAARAARWPVDHTGQRRVAAARIRRVRRAPEPGLASGRRWCCGHRGPRAWTKWRIVRPLWSGPERPPHMASRWPPTWRPGWLSTMSRWSPAARTASTARLTARHWPATGSPWLYWPAASISLIRQAIRRCCTASPDTGWCSPNTRRESGRRGTGS